MNRPAALAVVAVAGVAALAVGVGGWTNSGTQPKKQAFDQKITEIRLATGSGDVEVTVADVDGVEVEQRVRKFWIFPAKPKQLEVEGETLVLPEGCGGWNCSIDFIVRVPDGTKVTGETASGTVSLDGVASVDLRVASGDVDVTNVAGSVAVETGSGTVEADQVRGDVTVHTKSGDIHVDDVNGKANLRANSGTINADNLRDTVDAEAQSGDVTVQLTAPASVRARASSGSIDVRVPDGAYKVLTKASSGEADAEIDNDPNAAHTLDVSTSSGDITIERN
jgi:hypothetical protein